MDKTEAAGRLDKVTVYLPSELRIKLEHLRIDRRTTISSIVTDLAEKYVANPFTPQTPDRRKSRFTSKKGK